MLNHERMSRAGIVYCELHHRLELNVKPLHYNKFCTKS